MHGPVVLAADVSLNPQVTLDGGTAGMPARRASPPRGTAVTVAPRRHCAAPRRTSGANDRQAMLFVCVTVTAHGRMAGRGAGISP